MNKQISPLVAVIVVVVVVLMLAYAGYKIFLEPEKPRWSPKDGYGAPTYGQPMNIPSPTR